MKKRGLLALGIGLTLIFTGCESKTSSSTITETNEKVAQENMQSSEKEALQTVKNYYNHIQENDVEAVKQDSTYLKHGVEAEGEKLEETMAYLSNHSIKEKSKLFVISNRDLTNQQLRILETEKKASKSDVKYILSLYNNVSDDNLNILFILAKHKGKYYIEEANFFVPEDYDDFFTPDSIKKLKKYDHQL